MIVDDIYQTPKVVRETRKRGLVDGPSMESERYRIGMARNRLPLERSFWSRVHQPDEGCWDWQGSKDKEGYGLFSYKGKSQQAHRVALELSLGRPLAPGMFALHKCDRAPCCRPDHLYEGVGTNGR